ncbi:MAG: hypothetical protein JW915_14740 [Chitinispirillaceae bacterium]|nr:hypothetical protein [Chitinispirillaceae bacterium]
MNMQFRTLFKNKPDLFTLLLLLIYTAIFLFFHTPYEWHNDDSSYYIGTAESIVKHHSYDFNFAPQTKFPPGYPLFLSFLSIIFNKVSPDNTLFVKSTALLGLAGVALSYLLIRKNSSRIALCIVLLTVTSPWFFSHAITAVASDLPYFTVSILAILTGLKYESQHLVFKKILWGSVFTFALVATPMIRSIGITLFFAYLFYIILPFTKRDRAKGTDRFKKFLSPLLIGILSQVLWLYWSSLNRVVYYDGQYMDSYFSQIRLLNPHRPDAGIASAADLITRIFNNVTIQLSRFSEMFIHHEWLSQSWTSPFVIIQAVLLAFSILYRFRSGKADIPVLYFLFYMSMLLIWPFDEGQRFVFPIFPIICLLLCDGFSKFKSIFRSHPHKIVPLTFILLLSFSLISAFSLFLQKSNGSQQYIYLLIWIISTLIIFCILILRLSPSIGSFNRIKSILLRIKYPTCKVSTCCGILLLVCITLYGIVQEYNFTYRLLSEKPGKTALDHYASAATWLKNNTVHGSVAAATQIAVPHRISGLKVVPFPVTNSTELIVNTIRKYNVSYLIIVDEGKYPYFFPDDKERLNLLMNSGTITLNSLTCNDRYAIYKIDL